MKLTPEYHLFGEHSKDDVTIVDTEYEGDPDHWLVETRDDLEKVVLRIQVHLTKNTRILLGALGVLTTDEQELPPEPPST